MVKFPFTQIGKTPKLASSYRGPFEILKKKTKLK